MIDVSAPSQADNPEARAFFGRLERATASPGMLSALARMFIDIDVRDVVPSVHAPPLILHRTRDRLVNVRHGRWLAEHLPNARMVELEGDDHIFWYEGAEECSARCRSSSPAPAPNPSRERVLATVLFTDIVDSTRKAAELGDQRWREVLERHQRGGARGAGSFQRPRGEVDRGRVSGHVRRPRPRDPLRRRDPRIVRARWGSAFAPAFTPASAR